MDKEIKAQWLAALRSGEYAQGAGALSRNGLHCCLGVLCELAVEAGVASVVRGATGGVHGTTMDVFGATGDREAAVLPRLVSVWAGLDPTGSFVQPGGFFTSLAGINDDNPNDNYATVIEMIEAYF